VKFPEIELGLHEQFKERRSSGRKCSAKWTKKTSRKILAQVQPAAIFSASKGWFFSFSQTFKLTPRKRSNSKEISVLKRLPFTRLFHRYVRLFLCTGNNVDPKWGRFPPFARFNGDQVPLPFVCEQSETYDHLRTDRVWIR